MAQGSKPAAPAAQGAPQNGISVPQPPAGVNRKKQKRREKAAAKQAAEAQKQAADPPSNGAPPHGHGTTTSSHSQAGHPLPAYSEERHDASAVYDDEGDFYSDEDEDEDGYDPSYAPNGHTPGAYPASSHGRKKTRRKKRTSSAAQQPQYHPPPLTHHDPPKSTLTGDPIWDGELQEERQRIKDFWLSLGEEDRKSLVKIEKEAVLRKMKEQQKQSCSCTVCGRKRTAIEEELEILYDAYYEELEQYANHQQYGGSLLRAAQYAQTRPGLPHHRRLMTSHPPPGQYDDPAEFSEDDDEERDEDDYSHSEISSDGDYGSEAPNSLPPPPESDFLSFGSSLQVQGGILTVADDLLKNDGKKFIEMMEQLAERRMQREEEARDSYPPHTGMFARTHGPHTHAPEEDEYEDEDEDEEGYEDADYEEDEGLEEDPMTEEQRMEEGRRMFQIFAARMFEQRVLQAYREKVANERQNMLLAEEEREREEERLAAAKKAEEAQKRREKRERQRQAKAEKEAQKAAEKAAKEAKAKAKQEELLEEQRKKKEEQRKKKEAERKALEEERKRKEAERLRRQQEEKERQAEAERKQRELKAQEKKAKEESRRKEREEREAKEKEIKERKAQEEKERREREAKAKADRERLRKEEQAAAAAKKPTVQPVGVALPPGLLKQTSSAGLPSPHVTPAVPKAPTPSRPRQSSQQGSHMSSPKTPHALPGSSNSVSPGSQNQPSAMPRAILTKPQASQHSIASHLHQPAHQMPPMGPPPGMHPPPGMTMPPGLNGFPGLQNPMPPGMTLPRHSISHAPGFPHQQPGPRWGGFPPAVHAPGPMPMSRGFSLDAPPGFSNMPPFSSLNQVNQMPGFDPRMATHSRQGSGSESFAPAPPTQPIQRPTPIQRPSSAKPDEDSKSGDSGIDEISDHLGSKALLDDVEDEPQPEPRRTSLQPGSLRTGSLGFGFHDAPPVPTRSDSYNSFHGPGSIPSVWGTPPMPFALSGPGGWGNSPTSGLFNNAPQWAPQQRPGEQRIVWIRRLLCDVCKSLRVQTDLDGFIDGGDVFEAVNSKRGASEMAINFQEIKEACDIIGDHSNGGGNLEYREPPSGSGQPPLSVRFVETTGPSPPALGEIGSPVPSHSALAGGNSFGRPFAGLGPPGL